MPILRRTLFLLSSLILLSGCTRGISVGSASPEETYSINVQNLTGVTMVVSYDDGRGDAVLGTVNSGATERFIIAAPATRTISVRGDAVTGARRSGPHSVSLIAGTPQVVRLR